MRYKFLIIIFFLLLLVTLIEQKLSIFLLGGFWVFIGDLLITLTIKNEKERAKKIFYSFFIIYFAYSILCNYVYVMNPMVDYFYAVDSLHYFKYSNNLGELNTVFEVFHTGLTDFISADWKGFAIITGTSAFFSNLVDQNNIFVQKIIIIFFSAIIIPYVFCILNKYFTSRVAYKMSLVYGLLSYSLFYSAVYIRDVPIGFLFILLIYIFYTSRNIYKIILFIFISSVIFLFRPDHGIFSLIFLVAYLYLYLKDSNSKFKYLLVFLIVIIGVLTIGNQISAFFNVINNTTDGYLDLSVSGADSSSFGKILLKLPWGLRHVAAGLFSQTLPFPFYVAIQNGGLGFIPLGVAALFWFFIWIVILKLLFNGKYRKIIDHRLWLLFGIACLLVLGASVNADTRRVMAVYPIFFVIGMRIYAYMGKYNRVKLIFLSLFLYSSLLCVFLILKS